MFDCFILVLFSSFVRCVVIDCFIENIMNHEAMFPMNAFKGFVICWDVTSGNFLILIFFYIFDCKLVDPGFVGV